MDGGGLDEGFGVVFDEAGRHSQQRLHSQHDASIREETAAARQVLQTPHRTPTEKDRFQSNSLHKHGIELF